MVISLKAAKASSLKKWNKILSEYPDIKYATLFSRCAFCQRMIEFKERLCTECEVYNVCAGDNSLWRRIGNSYDTPTLGLKSLIEQMIKAIESVEVK